MEVQRPEEVICGPRSKDSPNQSYHSGKRKEMKTKHIGKEGPTGLGNLDKNQMINLVLSDQGPHSKKGRRNYKPKDSSAAYPQLQAWEDLT